MKKLIAVVAVSALAAPAALASTGNSLKASPNPVQSGAKAKLSGSTTCGVGKTVTIYSKAFKGSAHHTYGSSKVPAVTAKVNSSNKFSKSVTIQSSIASGKYAVGAVCGGHKFASTHLTVSGGPGFYN